MCFRSLFKVILRFGVVSPLLGLVRPCFRPSLLAFVLSFAWPFYHWNPEDFQWGKGGFWVLNTRGSSPLLVVLNACINGLCWWLVCLACFSFISVCIRLCFSLIHLYFKLVSTCHACFVYLSCNPMICLNMHHVVTCLFSMILAQLHEASSFILTC